MSGWIEHNALDHAFVGVVQDRPGAGQTHPNLRWFAQHSLPASQIGTSVGDNKDRSIGLGRSIHSEVIEMIELKKALTALWNDDEGLTTVEYAVAGGLIAAVVVGAFLTLGGTVGGIITYINTQLQASPGA
jgi:pilus assembly protein Flp/PilA